MGNMITSPIKTIGKHTGWWNYKKQIIRDHAADQRAHELNVSRQNNKYVSKVKKTETFANLEDAVAYKEWLIQNGPGNLHSPYYTSVETRSKQDTSSLGFTGHPNVYINWENNFDYNSYNRDLANATASILSCKQQIQDEAARFRQIISNCESEGSYLKSQILQLKSLYNSCRNEYSELCNKNSQLNDKLNKQLSILAVKKSEYASKSEQLNQLKSQVKNISKELGMSSYYKEEDVLSAKLKLEHKELAERLSSLNPQDRTKLLFKIYGDEKQVSIFNIIKSIGIDLDLLAYMACKFNKTSVLEYAVDRGASLDEYFVSEKTTIETILQLGNPEHIELMLSHSSGFICTIINAAEHNNLDVLSKIYQLDKTAFTSNDTIIGYTPIHFLLLGDYIPAFEYVISMAPECLDSTTLAGESLLKVGLRSASSEMLTLLISKCNNIEDQIKLFIANDEDALAIKLIDHIKLDVPTMANNILFAVEKGRDDLAFRLTINNSKMEEIIHYIEALKDNKHARKFMTTIIHTNNSSHFDFDSLIEEAELIEIANKTVDFLEISEEKKGNECQETPTVVAQEVPFQVIAQHIDTAGIFNSVEDKNIIDLIGEYYETSESF